MKINTRLLFLLLLSLLFLGNSPVSFAGDHDDAPKTATTTTSSSNANTASSSNSTSTPKTIKKGNQKLAEAAQNGFLDKVIEEFKGEGKKWGKTMKGAGSTLFLSLAVISLVWTIGFMAAKGCEIGEMFAELIKFMIFTGLYWFFLQNADTLAEDIISSFSALGSAAGSGQEKLTPTAVLDLGFDVFFKAFNSISGWTPIDSLCIIVVSVPTMVVFVIIAINLFLLLLTNWIMAYAGIFFLGFGGSKWTSDMAISYFKSLIGVAAQLMTMLLLIGIGKNFVEKMVALLGKDGDVQPVDVAIILVSSLILLFLVNKIPSQVASMVSGGGGGSIPTLGDAVKATANAAGTVASFATGAAAVAKGVGKLAMATGKIAGKAGMGAAGLGSALKAAFTKGGGSGGGSSQTGGGASSAKASGGASSGGGSSGSGTSGGASSGGASSGGGSSGSGSSGGGSSGGASSGSGSSGSGSSGSGSSGGGSSGGGSPDSGASGGGSLAGSSDSVPSEGSSATNSDTQAENPSATTSNNDNSEELSRPGLTGFFKATGEHIWDSGKNVLKGAKNGVTDTAKIAYKNYTDALGKTIGGKIAQRMRDNQRKGTSVPKPQPDKKAA
jgi:type IV secretion system protein VirB6/type IV secretion system protein TrbL